jgi:single-strand DNA-binding protein
MALSINKATLIGHVGADPTFGNSNNKEYARLSVATTKNFKDKDTGEWKDNTEWHTVFVTNAHLLEYIKKNIKKGSHIYVEGEIKYKKYKDKDGIEKWTTSINVGEFNGTLKAVKLESSSNGNGAGYTHTTQQPMSNQNTYTSQAAAPIIDDDIPF